MVAIERVQGRGPARTAQRGDVVRGSYLRSTIHTVASADFLAFRPVLQQVIDRELETANWRAISGGFDPARVEPLARALMAQRPMSAQELGAALLAHFPDAQKAGLGHWVRTRVALAIVPSDDRWGYPRPPRFVPAEQWLQQPLAPASTAELLLHGIAAIGPASSADLRSWSGLRGIKPALEALRPRLQVYRDESGRELFDLPQAPRPRADTPAPVRLLPEYDNVFLSHDDRDRIVMPQHSQHFTQTANGRRLRAVLVDGFVRAGWSHACDKGKASIQVKLFDRFDAGTRDDIATEALALLHFLEPDADHHDVELHP
ncbi:winged helix DNA-binding domain-containing protein [Lysobacter sp. GCM10012299]|uniref:winged helix DNA-binding domain-containing protein n=1 Tax=Lysobacter sp. GCM10012299 TaxID=3317333 RepID=UPI0036080B2E